MSTRRYANLPAKISEHKFSAVVRKYGDSYVITIPPVTARVMAAEIERTEVPGMVVTCKIRPRKAVKL